MRITSSLLALLLAGPLAAGAQTISSGSVDSRWHAWLGCWQQLEESVRTDNILEPGTDDAVVVRGVAVCVTPAAQPAAVTLTTFVEKQAGLQETIVADGVAHAVDQPGCSGTQTAEWAANGLRLYASAELTCQDGKKRAISGLTAIVPGPVWIDIQVVRSEGGESIRVRRYRRSQDQSHASERLTSEQLSDASSLAARQARTFGLEEVKEASRRVASSVLEAALIESDARFALNARRLQELEAAGVPDRVMDLMIALSYPRKFVVERRAAAPVSMPPMGGSGSELWWFDAGYDIFPYYYAPFGYGAWGRYDFYAYGGPVYVVDGGGPPSEPRPSGQGRVVDGLGYTRVRERPAERAESAGLVSGSAGSDASSSSSGSGSSGGGVSSQGYSSGGGGDSGRTAVPRPPD